MNIPGSVRTSMGFTADITAGKYHEVDGTGTIEDVRANSFKLMDRF